MASIRPVSYVSDRPALDKIFRQTCGTSLKTEPSWTIASYLWCHPYPQLSPSTCFVLDPGNGQSTVGYILSTLDTRKFASDWEKVYVPSLDKELLPPPSTSEEIKGLPAELLERLYGDVGELFNFGFSGLVDRWPGHLHIDILPEWQGKGWGRKMMATLLSALAKEGCKGVHLGMEAGNAGALKFYLSLGFERFPEVLDGGASGEVGRTGEQGGATIYLVKSIEVDDALS